MLETTIVGSLPKLSWLTEPETLCTTWRLNDGARELEAHGVNVVQFDESTFTNTTGTDQQYKRGN